MAKIKTFELDRWSEPDEKRRVRHIGMADAKETFDRLQTHLELKGLLPDEYFLFSDELTGELPEFDQALCIPNFGASEGIYLDISLACRDKDGKHYFQNFATGKKMCIRDRDHAAGGIQPPRSSHGVYHKHSGGLSPSGRSELGRPDAGTAVPH